MEGEIFEFVGGRQDGNRVIVGQPTPVGVEIRLPLKGDPVKAEVYVLRDDGRFHFDRFSYANPQVPKDPAVEAQRNKQFMDVFQQMAPLLKKLHELCQAAGGYPNSFVVDGWELRKHEEKPADDERWQDAPVAGD
jgi:hypothetical protein